MKKKPVPKILWVYITVGGAAAAERMAATLVAERLAACANVLPGIRSVYRWRGAVERAREAALIVKTRADRFEALRARVCELHEYEVPCIVAMPIVRGHAPFLRWVAAESAPASAALRRGEATAPYHTCAKSAKNAKRFGQNKKTLLPRARSLLL